MSEQPKDDKHWGQYRKPKGSTIKKLILFVIGSAVLGAFLSVLLNSFGIENSHLFAGGICGGIVGGLSGVYFSKDN